MPALIIDNIKKEEESLARDIYFKALNDIDANMSYLSADIDRDLYDISTYYLNKQGCVFLVGKLYSQLIATGALWKIESRVVELKRLAVHPDHQRKGFGKQMLQALERRAELLKYHKIVLDTSARQTAARSLYVRQGYNENSRESDLIYFYKNLI